ncbi:hypothetical protein M413DRAFT_29591 [Hebeloma cylindrosporum]|uniref:F-box domain-containing protein n=1 Tax=Hebeloma cylindrosporum TaxID=76867 RepID=A0A0C2YD99_HEBCY|nr:hypothetical protein M413DRAFT_29591 [Hebeloma cylindrosporum h7]
MPDPLSLIDVLPQDLIDLLIDLLWSAGERFAIRECASLCRAFLPRSQHHWFSFMKLTHGRVPEFYDILQRTPSIARAVRSLHLVFNAGRCDWKVDAGAPEFMYILKSITQPTTSTESTSLRELKLEDEYSNAAKIKNPQLFIERVFKPFFAPHIKSLHIENLSNVPIDVIDACIGLTELALVGTSLNFKYGRSNTQSHPQFSPRRHKLKRLEHTDSAQLKRLTMADPQTQSRLDLSELRSLYVHIDSMSEAAEQWVIDESAGALEELHFYNFDDPECELGWFINLRACSNLRVLDLYIRLGHPTPGGDEDDIHTLSLVLSRLPKRNRLDTIRLQAYVGHVWRVDDPQDILNADWDSLQRRLLDVAAGKASFEFDFRMIYLDANDKWMEEGSDSDDGMDEESDSEDGMDEGSDEGTEEGSEKGMEVKREKGMRELWEDGMHARCEAALDRLRTEKLAKLSCVSVVNVVLSHYVDIPHQS